MPSPEQPLTGRCNCGAVTFAVTAPFEEAGYCHCKRCQRRTGSMWSVNAAVPAGGFEITAGREKVRSWAAPNGWPKAFCSECGSHLYSGGEEVGAFGVRLGALDGDPGIRPSYRQWLESSPDWYEVPDDGLERFRRGRR